MYSYDSRCLYRDGRPWFPFMGEVHYARLPACEWRDALLKMKAGGVNIVASYSFWIHHEEIKGQWDFDGSKNLRRFIETVKDCGLVMFLRIGPWSHGEARNGGFPDWLLKENFEVRTNDPAYLQLAEGYYRQLFEQAEGLLFKDGGPIIGIQIENEYGHCGGLTGEAGEAHMRTLTALAKKVGFDVPITTATGWNGAVTGGLLPVMGGYCDAPWDPGIDDIKTSGNFNFSYERNDLSIGSDMGLGTALSYDASKFPYITAELGGGLQVTKHRRVVPSAQDTAAMSIAKLGSGCCLLGYYMYHGGVNPAGKLTTLEESKKSGGYNDLPSLSYDFHAPLGAYGQYNDSYHELRMLAMFVEDFGETLCMMPAFIPEDNPQDPTDRRRFRYSFRHNGEWGYVFFNNHVRHMTRPAFPQVALTVQGMGLTLPAFDVSPGQYGFFPFNMPIKGGRINFARATPLCTINGTTVLYGTEIDAAGDTLLISRKDALKAYKIKGATERLIISNNPLVQDGENIHIFANKDFILKVFPDREAVPQGFERVGTEGVFAVYERKHSIREGAVRVIPLAGHEGHYQLQFSNMAEQAHDYLCQVKYTADSAKVYIEDNFVYDDFYSTGQWTMGLRRHGFPNEMEVRLNPLYETDAVYLEAWPPIKDAAVCRLDGVELIPVERVCINVQSV